MLIVLIIGLILIVLFVKLRLINTTWVKKYFKCISLTITGHLGAGKDTLMSYIAYGREHNCNFKLQENTNIISTQQLIIPNLDRPFLKSGEKLNLDFEQWKIFDNMTFISDAGVYFPNFEDNDLKKQYTSLAYSIAMWRHLYNAPIHFNTQNFERLWKILREQIDEVLYVNWSSWVIPGYVLMKVTYYESAKDLVNGKVPLKHSIFSRSVEKVEDANRFEITSHLLLLPKRMIKHDSRYFKKLVFKEENEEKK
jgi:hypothetical protein